MVQKQIMWLHESLLFYHFGARKPHATTPRCRTCNYPRVVFCSNFCFLYLLYPSLCDAEALRVPVCSGIRPVLSERVPAESRESCASGVLQLVRRLHSSTSFGFGMMIPNVQFFSMAKLSHQSTSPVVSLSLELVQLVELPRRLLAQQ